MRKIIFVFLVIFTLNSYAQKGIKRFKLSKELTEISGLEKFNDTILVAINDGGNSPEIYFLDLDGIILKKTFVKNALNRDWEDITMDDKRNLYIADVGNNQGSFKEFYLLKLNVDEAYNNDTVTYNKLRFTYPLKDGESSPDCEAIYWFQDSLHLITKNNTKLKHEGRKSENKTVSARCPKHYILSDDKPHQTAIECDQNIPFLQRVRNRGIKDLVTAVDVKEGVCSVLTYGQLRTFALFEDASGSMVTGAWGSIKFRRLTQKEAVVIVGQRKVVVAAEGHPLLRGPFIYLIDL